MSGVFNRALVKRFGGGKLRGLLGQLFSQCRKEVVAHESSEMAPAESAICSRWLSRSAIVY
jgi:hypothetical protein